MVALHERQHVAHSDARVAGNPACQVLGAIVGLKAGRSHLGHAQTAVHLEGILATSTPAMQREHAHMTCVRGSQLTRGNAMGNGCQGRSTLTRRDLRGSIGCNHIVCCRGDPPRGTSHQPAADRHCDGHLESPQPAGRSACGCNGRFGGTRLGAIPAGEVNHDGSKGRPIITLN